jgi:hypothetical protein
MSALAVVRAALESRGCDPHGPEHSFRSRCPAHDGDNASALVVREGADERVVLWCHRGCATEDVVRALGLSWSDLFAPGHRHARRRRHIASTPTRPADLVLACLRRLEIAYRATASPDMWVAKQCPHCNADARYPLWILEDDRGRITLSCFNGCGQEDVLAALPGLVEGLAP